jgi:hypothetical protein
MKVKSEVGWGVRWCVRVFSCGGRADSRVLWQCRARRRRREAVQVRQSTPPAGQARGESGGEE